MVARMVVLGVLILAPTVALAQGASPSAPAADSAPSAPAAPAPPKESDLGPPGDVVTLKGGRVYRGFQVVKSSSAEVVLEVTPEVTISIPRRQIVSIEYDNIEPAVEREKRKAAQAAASAATMALLSGQKVPPEIQTKLNADISDPPIHYDKRDISDAIGELNMHAAVAGVLEVDKPVLDMPADQRQWTFSSTPGTTLAVALEALKNSLPKIATVIRNGKIVITDEETARQILATQEPAAPEPGAAQPGTPAAPPK